LEVGVERWGERGQLLARKGGLASGKRVGLLQLRRMMIRIKDMAARTLLLKLEERGWIRLTSAAVPFTQSNASPASAGVGSGFSQEPMPATLAELRPMVVQEVSMEVPRPLTKWSVKGIG